MFEDVFEELPWHLEEQADQAIRERQIKMASVDECDAVSPPEAPVRSLNMIQAINYALDVMLERDPDVIVHGRGRRLFRRRVPRHRGPAGKARQDRVFDTPITECGIIGVAVGMGANGLRPVPEIQFADYIYPGLDQLVSEAARLRYRSAGEFIAPMTVRSRSAAASSAGRRTARAPRRSSPTSSGMKTVVPSQRRTMPRAC